MRATAFGESNEDPTKDVETPIDALAPALGMIFNTEKDAYKYYNSYAKTIRFSVRKKELIKEIWHGLEKTIYLLLRRFL